MIRGNSSLVEGAWGVTNVGVLSGLQACPLLVSRLRSNPQWLITVVEKFLSLATSTHYIDRQGFLKICSAFLNSDRCDLESDDDAYRPFFIAHLSTAFFKLAKDPVLNVRLVFAELTISHQGMMLLCGLQLYHGN